MLIVSPHLKEHVQCCAVQMGVYTEDRWPGCGENAKLGPQEIWKGTEAFPLEKRRDRIAHTSLQGCHGKREAIYFIIAPERGVETAGGS